ncbi:hypothetical protein ACQCT3_10725 [Sutcliffiella horikoshii]|uniref:hypothetical protein n=1 Tax=Sutcliffiella horikoshii TaxID=79883 RepID=UPI003CEE9FFA
MSLRCSVCKKLLLHEDQVVLNEINSIFHAECYEENPKFDTFWKDFGQLENIINKYPFFNLKR